MFRHCRAAFACRLVLAAIVAILAPTTTAFAQFDTASVLGTVRDSTGAVVPGATVTLKNVSTGIVANTVSDDKGDYQFQNVRIGSYTVRAELQGFSAAEAEDVQVTVNARLRVDLALKVGNVGETVVVMGAATLLESESSDRGQVIGKEQIVNLPLNGRAYADLALLSPGVRRSAISDRATRPSTSTACAARSTASCSTASTTTRTAPATRASRTRSCSSRPTRSRSSRSRPTTSARSSAARAAPWSTPRCAAAPTSSAAAPGSSTATTR